MMMMTMKYKIEGTLASWETKVEEAQPGRVLPSLGSDVMGEVQV